MSESAEEDLLELVAENINRAAGAMRAFVAAQSVKSRSAEALSVAAESLETAAKSVRDAQDLRRSERERPKPGLYYGVGFVQTSAGPSEPWEGRLLYHSPTHGVVASGDGFDAEPNLGAVTLPGGGKLILNQLTAVDVTKVQLESLWRSGPGGNVYEVIELCHEAPEYAVLRLKYKIQGVRGAPLIEISKPLAELLLYYEQVKDFERVEA